MTKKEMKKNIYHSNGKWKKKNINNIYNHYLIILVLELLLELW